MAALLALPIVILAFSFQGDTAARATCSDVDRAKRDPASETFHQPWMQKFQFGATPPAGGNLNAPARRSKTNGLSPRERD
jgi:hypothetical protein